jgi:hypothetical protein
LKLTELLAARGDRFCSPCSTPDSYSENGRRQEVAPPKRLDHGEHDTSHVKWSHRHVS